MQQTTKDQFQEEIYFYDSQLEENVFINKPKFMIIKQQFIKTNDVSSKNQAINQIVIENAQLTNIIEENYLFPSLQKQNDQNQITNISQNSIQIEFTNQQTNQNEKINLKNEQEAQRKKLLELAEQMVHYFDEKLLDLTEQKRKEIEALIEILQIDFDNSSFLQQFHSNYKEKMSLYEKLYQQLIMCEKYLNETTGWKTEKNKQGIQIHFKHIENSKLIALKMEAHNLKMNLKALIAIIYEIDLYKKWLPFCNIGQNLKTVDKASKVVYLKADVPFISDRELYVYGLGIDRLDYDKTVIVMARTIDKDETFQKQCGINIEKNHKQVRIDMPFFTFQIHPKTVDTLEIKAVCNMDAHLQLVPDSIINLVTRKFAYFLFERMLEQNKKFKGSQYEKHIEQNQEFYGWIDQKINNYFINQQK